MDPHARNAGYAFDSSDMDHNGFLDEHDMSLVGAAVCDRLGVPDRCEARDAVLSAYRQAWSHACRMIGTDGRGRISRASYVRHAMRPADGRLAFVARIVWPIGDALWDALDADGDEQLTRAEYLRLFAAFDVEGSSARGVRAPGRQPRRAAVEGRVRPGALQLLLRPRPECADLRQAAPRRRLSRASGRCRTRARTDFPA
jgi:hypothetical protein